MMESDWLGDTCFRLSALVAQSKNKSSGSTNTNHTCCISHVDGGVLKILPVCLSLGQWKSLIRPWPANERRWVDGPGEEAKRKAISGNDYRLISLFILPLKRERETPPPSTTPPGPPFIVSQPLTPPCPRRHHPSQALIGPSLITLAPCSFTFTPVLSQICFTLSINNVIRSAVLSLHFSFCPSFLRSALLWNRGSHL